MRMESWTLAARRVLVLVTFAAVLSAYHYIGRRTAETGTVVLSTSLDDWVPRVPEFAWVYVLYYALLLWVFWRTCRSPLFATLYWSTISIVAASFVAFLLWPTRVVRTATEQVEAAGTLLALLWRIDPPSNCIPSLHVSLTIWAGFVGRATGAFGMGFAIAAWFAMSVSALVTGQHRVMDVVAGTAVGIGAALLAVRLGMFAERRSEFGRSTAGAVGRQVLPLLAVVVPLAVGSTFVLEAWSLARQDQGERFRLAPRVDGDEHGACVDALERLAELARVHTETPELPLSSGRLTQAQEHLIARWDAVMGEENVMWALRGGCPCAPPLAESELGALQDLGLRTLLRGTGREAEQGWFLAATFLGRPSADRSRRRLERLGQILRRITVEAVGSADPSLLRAQLDPVLEWLAGPVPQEWLLALWASEPGSISVWDAMSRRERSIERAASWTGRVSLLEELLRSADSSRWESEVVHGDVSAFLQLRRVAALSRVALTLAAFRRDQRRWPTSIAEAYARYGDAHPPEDPLAGRAFQYNGGSLEMRLVAPRLAPWAPELGWPR